MMVSSVSCSDGTRGSFCIVGSCHSGHSSLRVAECATPHTPPQSCLAIPWSVNIMSEVQCVPLIDVPRESFVTVAISYCFTPGTLHQCFFITPHKHTARKISINTVMKCFPEITVAPMAAGRERIHGVFLDIAVSLQRVPVKSHGASSRSCQLPRARRPRGGTLGQ